MRTVTITAASNMSDATYKSICARFSERLGECEFIHITDDGIIGGFIADVDGEIYDLSLASQLKEMHREITK